MGEESKLGCSRFCAPRCAKSAFFGIHGVLSAFFFPLGLQDEPLEVYRLHSREKLGVMEGKGSGFLEAYGVGTIGDRHWKQTPDSLASPVALQLLRSGCRRNPD